MAQERNNGGGGRTAATAGIIALLLLLGGGGYFGLGPGQGMLPGNGDSAAQEQSEGQGGAQEAAVQTEQDEKEEAVSGIPDNIVVTIKKDAVTINGHQVADSEELRKYVEEYNSDSRTFTLEEEESILDTYNWVKAVFDELDIQLAIGSYLLVTKQKMELSGMRRELILLIISGIAMGFNWILLFEAYKYTTVSVATLSYYAAPVIITLVSTLLFREEMTKRKLLCFVMSTLGILLITISGGGMSGKGTDHVGILFGLGAAVLYATVVLLNKFIKNVGGIQRTFLQFAAAAVTLFPYVMMTGGMHSGELKGAGLVLLLIVGLVHTGVAYCMYFSSLQHVPGQEAAVLSYIDPLVAVILSVSVLREPMSALQVIGGAMILGFTLLNELPEKE